MTATEAPVDAATNTDDPAAGHRPVPADGAASPADEGRATPGRARRLWRGRDTDPTWVRPALLSLLVGTALLYVWGLSANNWGNDFYAAAVQAGSTSWKAFFFGSSDAASSITVDKPPASLWPMALSVRLFGLNSWAILVPQALMGVATVGVVYASVRRWFTAAAGLLAGAVVALTPVAVLMFRYDNPDALLTLLMSLAAYTALRAVEDGRWRWYALCGVAVGFGFLTKQLQVLLVVPGFGLAGLIAGPGTWWRRVRGLLLAGGSMVLAGGWWVAIVELMPKADRPYIGGSPTNSFLELTFGYNGLGRISGDEAGGFGGGGPLGGGGAGPAGGPFGGAGGASPFGGATGVGRLFAGVIGGQIAWLLPAAIVAIVVGLWVRGRAPRRDLQRASVIVWGSWLLVTALVFSAMHGIFHEYYTVALAPAIGALVGIGAAQLWQRRDHAAAPVTAAVTIAGSTWWARELLGRADDGHPWLTTLVTAAGVIAAVGLVASAGAALVHRRPARLAFPVIGIAALVAVLGGPTAWSLQTVGSARTGPIVTAGPTVAGAGFGGLPGGGFPGGGELPGGARFPGGGTPDADAGSTPTFPVPNGTGSGGTIPDLAGVPGQGGLPTAPGGEGGFPAFPGGALPELPAGQRLPAFPGAGGAGASATGGGGFPASGFPGGPGSMFGSSSPPSAAVIAALTQDADRYTWVAATLGSMAAAPYQLAAQRPVMPIGGFSSTDPSPTLDQFEQYVAEGKIHWFIGGGRGAPFGAGGAGAPTGGSAISQWVTQNFTATTIDGVTLYDLTRPHTAS